MLTPSGHWDWAIIKFWGGLGKKGLFGDVLIWGMINALLVTRIIESVIKKKLSLIHNKWVTQETFKIIVLIFQ